jgi:hypothetical protein
MLLDTRKKAPTYIHPVTSQQGKSRQTACLDVKHQHANQHRNSTHSSQVHHFPLIPSGIVKNVTLCPLGFNPGPESIWQFATLAPSAGSTLPSRVGKPFSSICITRSAMAAALTLSHNPSRRTVWRRTAMARRRMLGSRHLIATR